MSWKGYAFLLLQERDVLNLCFCCSTSLVDAVLISRQLATKSEQVRICCSLQGQAIDVNEELAEFHFSLILRGREKEYGKPKLHNGGIEPADLNARNAQDLSMSQIVDFYVLSTSLRVLRF
jgi:hypothetical protein